MKRLTLLLAAFAAIVALVPMPSRAAGTAEKGGKAADSAAQEAAGPAAGKGASPASQSAKSNAPADDRARPDAPGAGEPPPGGTPAGDPAAAAPSERGEMPDDLKQEIERKRIEDARLATLAEAAAAHPDDAKYHIDLLAALVDLDRIEEAVAGGEEIVEKFPKSPEASVEFGRALTRNGSFDLAKLQFQRAIALDPANVTAHTWIGRIDLARGDRRSAEASFRKALSLDAARNDARFALAGLLEGAGKYAEAIAVLEGAPGDGGASKEAGARAELKGRRSLLRDLEKRPPYQLPSGFTSVTVPMKRVKGLPPLVSVKVGEKLEKLFIVDTGSDEVVLTSESARALGLPEKGAETLKDSKGREHPTPAYVVLDRVDLGTLTVKRIPARVAPGLRYPVEQIGGIIGRDFLRRFRPVLDYPAKTLTLARADGPPLQGGTPFDLMGAILIEGLKGDRQLGKFMIDTSSYTPGALDIQLVAAETGLTIFDEKVTPLPEGPYMFKFTMPRLMLAGVEFRNFPATAVDLRLPSRQVGVHLRGILGQSLLRECRLEIDFQNQRLSLRRKPAPAASEPPAGDALP